jgi:hypothetical protein
MPDKFVTEIVAIGGFQVSAMDQKLPRFLPSQL